MKIILVVLLVTLASCASYAQNYFTNGYESARKQFRDLSEKVQKENPTAELVTLSVPSQIDSDLTIDYIYIPPTKAYKNLFVITSGVHGAEAYAGSALQALILDKKIQAYNNTGILIIHTLNPYGFKYSRRVTEQNIDLNRNFDISDEIFNTPNSNYVKVQSILERNKTVTNLQKILNETFSSLIKLLLKGMKIKDLVQGIGQGQYESPTGLYYGGKKFEPQVSIFSNILDRYTDAYDKVAFLDIHTGAGPKGQLTLMSGRLTNEESWNDILSFFPVQEKSYYQLYNGNEGSFFYIYGDIIDFVTLKLKNKLLFSITAEYGTVGDSFLARLQSINRMITERQGFYNGFKEESLQKRSKARFMELFNPSSTSWRKSVITKGDLLFDQTLTKLEQ